MTGSLPCARDKPTFVRVEELTPQRYTGTRARSSIVTVPVAAVGAGGRGPGTQRRGSQRLLAVGVRD